MVKKCCFFELILDAFLSKQRNIVVNHGTERMINEYEFQEASRTSQNDA